MFAGEKKVLKSGKRNEISLLKLFGPVFILILFQTKNFAQTNDIFFERIFLEQGLSQSIVQCISQDKNGFLYIGTEDGLNIYNGYEFEILRNDPANQNSLSYNDIRALLVDHNNNIWAGTFNSGLNKFDHFKKSFKRFLHYPDSVKSLSHNNITEIIEDKTGNIWIGIAGNGISVLNKKDGKFRTISAGRNNFISPKGELKNISSNDIRDIFQDSKGIIWIGTYGNGLDKFDPANKTFENFRNDPENQESLSNNFVRIIFEDKDKNLWIGTEGGGLNLLDEKTKKFKCYKTGKDKNNWINNDYVFSIYQDKNGNLWLGTFGGGLNKFNPANETFESFTVNEGLASNAVYGVLGDEKENLWLSTNNGISKFNIENKKFTNFIAADGLQNNEFNGGSYYKSASGEMFFGGINGFNSFYPARIKENNYKPPVLITSFKKFNKEYYFDKPVYELNDIKLSYKDFIFSFEFASLDYTVPEKNKYAYKMEGLDKDWIFVNSNKRFAHYTTLPPGNYTFRLKATNSDGVWNDKETKLNIKIIPPFWKTLWFNFLLLFTFISTGFFFYKRRSKTIMMEAEIKAAHNAQMSIMPQKDPGVKGLDISGICIPANEVGGDFYDYFWLDEEKTKFGILIGDVSGKGMKAAMTAVMTSGMIIAETNSKSNICEIFYNMNRSVYEKTEKNIFVTAFFLVIELKKNEVAFVNAGHVKPIVKSNGKIKFINSDGPRFPLGIFKEVCYEENKFKIRKDDLLILMTDGLIEIQNKDKEFYGTEKLTELLIKIDQKKSSAPEIKKMILDDVQKFSGNNIHNDDVTLIIIKVL